MFKSGSIIVSIAICVERLLAPPYTRHVMEVSEYQFSTDGMNEVMVHQTFEYLCKTCLRTTMLKAFDRKHVHYTLHNHAVIDTVTTQLTARMDVSTDQMARACRSYINGSIMVNLLHNEESTKEGYVQNMTHVDLPDIDLVELLHNETTQIADNLLNQALNATDQE